MENKTLSQKLITAGNFVLHLMLGIGIASLFLKWERHWFMQLVISFLFPFGIAFFGEKFQQKLGAKPNIYDALNTGIAGLIFGIIYLFIFGWKFDEDIDPNQLPKMYMVYIGWSLIAISTIIWIIKQGMKFRNK